MCMHTSVTLLLQSGPAVQKQVMGGGGRDTFTQNDFEAVVMIVYFLDFLFGPHVSCAASQFLPLCEFAALFLHPPVACL